ncbi:hypothetical protein EDC19_2095 [Natranaerovirga hydrolytica]|uniref:Uncharacterized protein n=1 Tax=Natranaerovirga hydrolytica TaxID=680378 RepID=A0A4R1MIZ8_9FIRM|nr:hypothetical protein [Natranaerovirga hydrolytica]TCK92365.1 hypothetical protein EDC19_2095 [Natranaerovirga hydrolytica]
MDKKRELLEHFEDITQVNLDRPDKVFYFHAIPNDILENLKENNDILGLAHIYELTGIMDLKLNKLYDITNLMINFSAIYNIIKSCFCYYTQDKADYAKKLALAYYIDQLEMVHYLQYEYTNYDKYIMLAFHIEILGDLSLFFDQIKTKKHYQEADQLYSSIDAIVQKGETADYYWAVYSDAFDFLYRTLFDSSFELEDDGNKRISQKEVFFNVVKLEE